VVQEDDHLRQHERISRRDQQRLEAVAAVNDPGQAVKVTHWVGG
jgi:hypothetical protein